MKNFNNYTKNELIEMILSLEKENKFLKELYKGTNEWKEIERRCF